MHIDVVPFELDKNTNNTKNLNRNETSFRLQLYKENNQHWIAPVFVINLRKLNKTKQQQKKLKKFYGLQFQFRITKKIK